MDDLLNYAPCGFLTLSKEGIIVVVNATLLKLLGYELSELRGQHFEAILSLSGRLFYQSFFVPTLDTQGRCEEIFLSLVARNGQEEPMLMNVIRRERARQIVDDCILMPMRRRTQYEQEILRARKDAENAARQRFETMSALEDAHIALEKKQAELLEANAMLEAAASHDHLTGLKNRRAFQSYLAYLFALTRRLPSPLSVILIDVDHFKTINDTYGHPVGDRYLRQIASIISENLRDIDMVARYGGEEFAVILPDTDQPTALLVAERLRTAIAAARWPEAAITVSLGVSTLAPEITSEFALVFLADRALYVSKEHGRNRTSHADDLVNHSSGHVREKR